MARPAPLVATFGPGARRGKLAFAVVVALGGDRATKQVEVGNGAALIQAEAAWHFPAATAILDWLHLAWAVHRAIRATLPDALSHGRVEEPEARFTRCARRRQPSRSRRWRRR